MRILLIANYIPDAQRSMQSYANLLWMGFSKAGHEVRLLRPSVNAGKLQLPCPGVKWSGYIDKLVFFPRELRRALDWADIVHICDHSNAIYTKHIEDRPHVVTCHDLLAVRSALGEFPEHSTRWSGRRLQHMILDGLSRARNIICVSEATRADVLRLVPGANKVVTRIYNGLNYPWAPMDREQASARLRSLGVSPAQPFILHVGGNQWYKNRPGVLKTFALLRRRPAAAGLRLVMAGKPWTPALRQLADKLALKGSVVALTEVGEEDLRALYSTAKALLFPSLAEGFGWPVAEAQACGCPVVTSKRAPMTEVGGASAIYIDPLDDESAAAAMALALDNAPMAPDPDFSMQRFSTTAMVESYLEFYGRLLNGQAPHEAAASHLRCA